MQDQTSITPIKSTFQKWKIATLDIETRSTDGKSQLLAPFCMGATCLDGTADSVVFHDNIFAMMHYVISKGEGYRWFVHAGSRFDFRYFFNEDFLAALKHHGYRVDFIGSKPPKAFAIRKGHRRILVCDSNLLVTVTLKKGCESFGTKTQKGEIDFAGGAIFDPENSEHMEYLADDVICLHQLVCKYRVIINEIYEVEPGCTAASTAFRGWRKTLKEPFFKHSRQCSDFCRLSYYGGRTQIFFQGNIQDVHSVDINSLYPYIMREVGGMRKPYRSTSLGEKGFYRINAKVPRDIKFGPIPYRKPDNTGIIFPTGTFSTYCSSVEIIQALDMGCDIEIVDGYSFEGDVPDLFTDFIDKCERFRNMDYNGGIGITCKIMQNSLYGFFGMRLEKEELVFGNEHPDVSDNEWQTVYDSKGNMLDNLWAKNYEQDTINCIPALAAMVTACARVYLLKAMLHCEKAGCKVLMCDTDSIFCDREMPVTIGKKYGEFKVENSPPNNMIILAPKSYAMTGSSTKKDDLKCKGIPKKLLTVEDFVQALKAKHAGQAVVKTFPQLNSLTSVLVSGVLGKEKATRALPIPGNIKSMVPMGEDSWMKNIELNETKIIPSD